MFNGIAESPLIWRYPEDNDDPTSEQETDIEINSLAVCGLDSGIVWQWILLLTILSYTTHRVYDETPSVFLLYSSLLSCNKYFLTPICLKKFYTASWRKTNDHVVGVDIFINASVFQDRTFLSYAYIWWSKYVQVGYALNICHTQKIRVSLIAQSVKNLPAMQETGSIPGSGRSCEERNGNPLQDYTQCIQKIKFLFAFRKILAAFVFILE